MLTISKKGKNMFLPIRKNGAVIFAFVLSLLRVVTAFPGEIKNDSFSDCGITNATAVNPLIGGEETEPGDWPWLVYIRYSGSFCGGTLIDNIHVVTAAHCIAQYLPIMQIKLGAYGARSGYSESIRTVVKAAVHPGYKVYWSLPDQPSINDIAIITLNEPVIFSRNVKPICLPTSSEEDYVGEIGTTVGYGYVLPAGSPSDVIRELSSLIWSNEACRQKHFRDPVLDSHICSGEPGRAVCAGDSGSPLMVQRNGKWHIIGVVGWGREICDVDFCGKEVCEQNEECPAKACDPEYPGVYARISYYLPWIKQNL